MDASYAPLLRIAAIALVLIGLAGTVLPLLPGVPLVFAGLWLAAWIDGTAAFGSYDSYRQAAGFDANSIAINTGIDQRVGERGLFGISLGYNHDQSTVANDGTRSIARWRRGPSRSSITIMRTVATGVPHTASSAGCWRMGSWKR